MGLFAVAVAGAPPSARRAPRSSLATGWSGDLHTDQHILLGEGTGNMAQHSHIPVRAGQRSSELPPMILRRSLILALGSMPLLAGEAFCQKAVKARRVGLLSSAALFTDTSPVITGLTAGFSKRGYVVGSSLLFERRAAEAHADRLPRLVDDLKSQTELMITNAYAAARVIKDRSNVPVVAITGADPVATGLIDSLARPGGKITGIGEVAAELSAKRLACISHTN